jgi:hypothetical protein
MSTVSWAAWLLLAAAVMVLAYAVARRQAQPTPRHRWGRHVALQLPMLAPERWCACGCRQLAAPGAMLADWHYDVPGTLPPTAAPDTIAIQGLAWSYGPRGWEPAIVYVAANVHPDAVHQHPLAAAHHPPPPFDFSTNGHAEHATNPQ